LYWSEVAYLCKEITTLDGLRKPQSSFTSKEVFCNLKGVKRNEFYQAQAQGYKPELCVEIKACEFDRETHIKYNGTMYRILRTYPVKSENLELICTALVVENG